MPVGKILLPLIGLVGSVLESRDKRQASQSRIQTTVADAQAAGINPLTALGASGHHGADSGAGGLGAGLQGLSRSMMRQQGQSMQLDIDRKRLENEGLQLQLQKQQHVDYMRHAGRLVRTSVAAEHANAGGSETPVTGQPYGLDGPPEPVETQNVRTHDRATLPSGEEIYVPSERLSETLESPYSTIAFLGGNVFPAWRIARRRWRAWNEHLKLAHSYGRYGRYREQARTARRLVPLDYPDRSSFRRRSVHPLGRFY